VIFKTLQDIQRKFDKKKSGQKYERRLNIFQHVTGSMLKIFLGSMFRLSFHSYYPTSTRRHGNFAGVHTLLRIILSSNSAVLINIITGVSPPHFDFFVFYFLCQC
jgi:hypothetical protein